ncbi:hypothetical protein SCARD494_07847 [Seiridium cardinale]
MDWTGSEFTFTEHDLDLFQYEGRKSTLIQRYPTKDALTIETVMIEEDWGKWMRNNAFLKRPSAEAGLCVILCDRAKNLSDDEGSPVSYLPFERPTFEGLARSLRIHRTVSRTIARETAYFSATRLVDPSDRTPSIVMTSRMSSLWPNDLALSTTFFPDSDFTCAMVFGCDASQRRQLMARLAKAPFEALGHPLLLPGIFAELERKRLSERVEDTLDRFTLRTSSVSDLPDHNFGMLDMNEEQMGEYLQLCYQSQSLAKELKTVKRQLAKMVQFCNDFNPSSSSKNQSVLRTMDSGVVLDDEDGEDVMNVNRMLKERILEIMGEYDDMIEECDMVVDNMSITMQTVWSHIARRDAIVNTNIARANNSIALDAKQDNGQ